MDKSEGNDDIASKLSNVNKKCDRVQQIRSEILNDPSHGSKVFTSNSKQTSTISFNLQQKQKSGLIIDKEKENDIRKLTISNCKDLNSALKFMISPIIREEQENLESVLQIRFQVENEFENIDQEQIENLSTKFSKKSLVVFLESSDNSKFFIFWKSREIGHFLTLKPYRENTSKYDKKIYKFVADFLATSLKAGHLGIHKNYSNMSEMTNFELFFLADSRNYNLLLLAAEKGEAEIVESLLKLGMDTALPQQNINAQTLAWNGQHSNVLLVLIQANLQYPKSFEINYCSQELQKFYRMCTKLHEAVIANNEEKVKTILDDNPTIQYFYNSNNESVAKIAIANKCTKSYKLLLDRKIFLAPHENFEDLTENLDYADRRTLREIHFEHKKELPEKHLNILRLNSFVSHDVPNVQDKLDLVMKAYKILNQNVFLRIILLIIAASKNFKIIYDFNRDSVNFLDPTVSSDTQGLFYLSGRIYIGAKQLLSKVTEKEAYATLAHEFCHFAMHLVYGNGAIPYSLNDHQSMQEFEKISRKCQQSRGKEEVVDNVYELYPPDMHHAELIVRVPHMLALYHDQPEKIRETRETFPELYDHYEKKMVPAMVEAIPDIETRDENIVKEKDKQILNLKKKNDRTIAISFLVVIILISTFAYFIIKHEYHHQMFKFDDLEANQKEIVRNSSVKFKNKDFLLKELFPDINHHFYSELNKTHIDQFLNSHNNISDLSDPTFSKVNTTIFTKWDNMPDALKSIFLKSTFSLQDVDISFEKFYNFNHKIFEKWSFQEIDNVLDGEPPKVGKETINKAKACYFVERRFVLDNGLDLESFSTNDQESKDEDEDYSSRKYKRSVQNGFESSKKNSLLPQSMNSHNTGTHGLSIPVANKFSILDGNQYRYQLRNRKSSQHKNGRTILHYFSSRTQNTSPESTQARSSWKNTLFPEHGITASRGESLSTWEKTNVRKEQHNLSYKNEELSSQEHLVATDNPNSNPESVMNVNPHEDQIFWIQQDSSFKNEAKHLQRRIRSSQNEIQSSQMSKFFNSQELINSTLNNKVFILSSEFGNGKAITLRQLAFEIKQKFPDRWVCFIDLKEHIKSYNESGNFDDFWKLMNETVKLKHETDFGRKVFLESFKKGEVVFIWDGIEVISKFKSFILNVLKFIRVNTENVQFIGTGPLYTADLVDNLKGNSREDWMTPLNNMIFNETGSENPESQNNAPNLKTNSVPISFSLVPYTEVEQEEFLRKAFITQKVEPENLNELMENVKNLMTRLKTKAKFDTSNREFNTPVLLAIFREAHSSNLLKSGNLYEIYENFLGNNKESYQKQALKAELSSTNSTIFLKLHKFEIFTRINQNSIDFSKGIVNNKGNNIYEFSHKSFSEFYVAQYLIENVYDSDIFNDPEAGLRLELLFYVVRSYGYFQNGIIDFMEDYIKINRMSQSQNAINSISGLLKKDFKKFFINLLDTEYPKIFNFLVKFFGKQCETLKNLLQVDEKETFYTSIFNPIYGGSHVNPWDINFDVECLKEYNGFKDGKDQRGIFLLGIFIKIYNEQLNLKTFNEFLFWNIANITLTLLNKDEKIQLCKVLLNPKIYLKFGFENLSSYDVMWTMCERMYSIEEVLKEMIGHNLASLLETDPNKFLTTQIEFVELYINKIKLLLSIGQVSSIENSTSLSSDPLHTDSDHNSHENASSISQPTNKPPIPLNIPNLNPQDTIFTIFKDNFILHKASRQFSLFKPLWDFFHAYTNETSQEEILKFQDNGEFFHFYDLKTSNINQYYDGTKMIILHRALLATGNDKYLQLGLIKEIYSKHFNSSKIRDIIVKDIDFISYILQYSDESFCEQIADYFLKFFTSEELNGLLIYIQKRVSVEMDKKAIENLKIFRRKVDNSNKNIIENISRSGGGGYRGISHAAVMALLGRN